MFLRIFKTALLSASLCCSNFAASDDNFTEQLGAKLTELQIPGAQVVLLDSNQFLLENNFGISNAEKTAPVTTDTLFRAGSTTKTFIALAIMQLINQGKFSLEDDVLKLEPALALDNPWHTKSPVRVIHLLEHTAGLDDMHFRNFYNVSEPAISMLDAVNRDRASLKVRWQPGTRFAYSNPGYGILGHLIEKFSGQRFEQYVSNQILTALNINECQFNSDTTAEPMLSAGFVDGEAVPFRQIYLRSAGNLHCSASGLAKLTMWLLNTGQQPVIPDIDNATVAQMEQPQSSLAAQKGLQYGYGKAIYHATRSGRHWLGHNGGIDGFTTSYGYSHELNRGYVLMVNSSSASIKPLLDLITGHLAADTPLKDVTFSPLNMPELNGYYRVDSERNQLFAGISFSLAVAKLSLSGDTLHVKPVLGEASEYRHIGSGRFSKAGENHARAIIIGDTSDGFTLDIDGDYLVKTSALHAWLPIILLASVGVIFVLTLIYAPIWIINAYRGKLQHTALLWLRALPFISVGCIIAVVIALFNLTLIKTAQLNWQTLTIYLGTIGFALAVIAATILLLRAHQYETSRFARYFGPSSIVVLNLFALYCFYFNYIGLALWQW